MTKQEAALLRRMKTSKKVLRKDLRKLSFYEKIARIIEMQKLSKKLAPMRQKKKIFVWNLD